ncbi:monocarboxylate transporter 1-like [Mya arenaria]|uniref:monocarboxylate transporter 1-like n=1 Tax=Mya arenaria TaxID=6604 RepID=UPI0022E14663|nr:monocarboxylate transporter 1-like [Mya arenaria]XP_052820327.1 monocarboxylate transporter 1-like [Mya arenaria]
MGTLYLDIEAHFQRGRTATSGLLAGLVGVVNSLGILSGALIRRIGLFRSSIIASILIPTGVTCSFYAKRLEHLYISLALVGGSGISLFNVVCITTISKAFTGRQRHVCLSILSTGTGLAGVFYPFLLPRLVEVFGLMGTFLVLGGLFLNVWIISILIYWNQPRKMTSEIPDKIIENDNEKCNIKIISRTNDKPKEIISDLENGDNKAVNTTVTSGALYWQKVVFTARKVVLEMREVLFLENVLNMVGTGLLMAAINAYLTLQLDIAASRGLSREEGQNAFVVVNSVNVISGLVPGFLKQIPGLSYSCLLIVVAVFGLTGHSLILLSSGALLYFLASALIGVSLGGVLTSSLIGLKIVRPELISVASGTLITMMGLLTAASGPLLGYFRDITSDYNLVLYITISIHVLAVILYVTAFATRRPRVIDVTVYIK